MRLARGFAALAVVAATVAWGPLLEGQEPPASDTTALLGTIHGSVVDETGAPVPGAVVSALGPRIVVAETDGSGRFSFPSLPAASYQVRALLHGRASSSLETVGVRAGRLVRTELALTGYRVPADAVVGTGGDGRGPVLAAGLTGVAEAQPALPADEAGEPAAESATQPDEASGEDHSHTSTAWRVRHLPRSVLRDSTDRLAELVEDSEFVSGSVFRTATASGPSDGVLLDLPVSGEVNLLTTATFDGPRDLFLDPMRPRGITYVEIGAPVGRDAQWNAQGAMTQGDLASWVVAGSYESRGPGRQTFDAGMSYSTQRYEGGNAAALAAVSDGARNVGEVYGSSYFRVSPGVGLSYGGRYARYDYIEGAGFFSPHVGLTVAVTKAARLRGGISQRLTAPGAEEFLPPPMPGFWLPPERTFSPLPGAAPFRPERTRQAEVAFEYEGQAYTVGVRRFFQRVNDQLVTVFGAREPTQPAFDIGHYFFASPGSVELNGMGASFTCTVAGRVHGSVDYSWNRAQWSTSPEAELVALWAASAVRRNERFHDVTTAVETDIPETATRVFVIYRLNSAFSQGDPDGEPGMDARFDVRVHQGLPFLAFTNVDWELLVAVRNLFREVNAAASAYDELLVVRPPKRIVGGLLLRF